MQRADEQCESASEPAGGFEAGSEANGVSGTTVVQIPPGPFLWRMKSVQSVHFHFHSAVRTLILLPDLSRIRNMTNELREFVYLDSMSVNSLLASQYMAIPEAIRDVSENIREESDEGSIGGGVDVYGIGELSAELSRGDTEESRQVAETERRINDQYRFSILHASLESEGQLINLDEREANNDESLSFSQGDVVKATGNTTTDPFYRVLSSISSVMRISKVEQIEKEQDGDFDEMTDTEGEWIFDTWKDILHGERIGLKIDPRNYSYPVLMSVKTDELWVDPEREFIGGHDYTVVGRVSQVLAGNNKWDFVDLLQIMKGAFSDDSIDQFRDIFSEVAEDMNEVDEEGFSFDVDVDRGEYVVEEPSIVVEPIAIYW